MPWPTPVEVHVIQFLTHLNTLSVTEVLGWLGIPASVQGNLIEIDSGVVGIDEACSGIRSLQVIFMMSVFLGAFRRLPWKKRLLLIPAGLLTGMLLNLVRTLVLVLIANQCGLTVMRQWHDATGIGILLGAFWGLWIFAFLLKRGDPSNPDLTAPSGRAADLAAWQPLRVSTPGFNKFGGMAVVVGIGGMAASELWFQSHESQATKSTPWQVVLPEEAQTIPVAEEIRSQLRYDSGLSAMWKGEGSVMWRLFYFRWNPSDNLQDRARVQLAKRHRPDICLPAGGKNLQRELPEIEVAWAGMLLRFKMYEFAMNGVPLYVFYAAVEDGMPDGAAGNMRANHWERFAAAWKGNRSLGQRTLELALGGVREPDNAVQAFKEQISRLLVIADQPSAAVK